MWGPQTRRIFSVSSIKSTCLHYKTRSSLAINLFVGSAIHIWRWLAETISLLVMSAFVYKVNSCLEVSSKNCLLVSDKCFCLLLEVGLETPQKWTELGDLRKTWFQVRTGPVEGQKQGRDEKIEQQYPTMEWWRPPLWPPRRDEIMQEDYPIHLLPIFCRCKVVFWVSLMLAWKPNRRPPSFRSSVLLFNFLVPDLFLSILQVQP